MKRGFTLVELSIVLVIIGLLIGGILVAQSMISTARNQSIIRDIEKYRIAIRLFENQYGYLPGTTSATQEQHWGRGPCCSWWGTTITGFSMWGQMYQMGMLDQKYDASILTTGSADDYLPANWPGNAISKLANSAVLYGTSSTSVDNYDLTTGIAAGNPINTPCTKGNFLRMGSFSDPGADYGPLNYYNNAGIDTVNALAIDTKTDDGNGSTGNVMADGYGPDRQNPTSCKGGAVYINAGAYNITQTGNRCLMYFCAETDN